MAVMRGVEFDLASHSLTFKEDLPRPCVEAPSHVLVRVSAAGICGTDLHLVAGGLDKILPPKMIFGHEVVGHVEEIGSAVRGIEVGQYVVVQPMGRCFSCKSCNAGHLNLCELSVSRHLGYGVRGGWADLCLVEDHQVYPMPSSRVPPEMAVLVEPMGGVLNGWRQLGAALTMEKRIVILGGGLIGCLWAAVLSYRGFRHVVVSEPSADRRALLRRWKGVVPISPEELWPEYENRIDVLIDCCAIPEAVESAMRCLSDAASILIFGVYESKQVLSLDLHELMFRELSLVSALGNNHTFNEAITLVGRMFDDGDLTVEKVGMRSYSLSEHESALKDLSTKIVTKAVLVME